MSAGNLAAWNIGRSDFPRNGTAAEKARFAVGYAILAPSSHNTQPWRFVIVDDELLVCAAAASGFSAWYLNQPIEVPELRQRLARDAGTARCPQLVLRVGRGPSVPHSPRRPLTDVLA
jgi:nitroreductase